MDRSRRRPRAPPVLVSAPPKLSDVARGTVSSLHRWPVKSMGGEQVPSLRVDRRGAAGDHAHAVVLELLHACERCVIPARDPDTQRKAPAVLRWLHRERGGVFGVNARALAAGTIRAGDRVELF